MSLISLIFANNIIKIIHVTANCSVATRKVLQNVLRAEHRTKFEDLSSFEIAIQQYQTAENVQLFWWSSRTIATAYGRMQEKILNELLKPVLQDHNSVTF